ncbi:hypothetical protein JDV02_000375 [Purpureocillium takamizusanense]|uniref:Uncharacterized protein n=1 Tax=Purpureocillium takamizusanense TaxID=2060973 RepID=A0A9Q8V6C2_9HYPO|nr:uncharacterized protein JDV02_000375 [Purpureocillium takamizusanense]UNI13652.1 hypothetical protein JDV02_000375 [Purpureocillium takamizusanense]
MTDNTTRALPHIGETNVVLWNPGSPEVFAKARDATIFTRLATRHSSQELDVAVEATPGVDHSFCVCVNNVLFVFSASQDEHTEHCQAALRMLQACSLRLDLPSCVFKCATSVGAGVRLEQIGQHRVFMVINEGVPPRA